MLISEELWKKLLNGDHITLEDIGMPSWRRECDGFYYELESLLYKSGIAYKHKNGYRWSDGTFLTKKECHHYDLECGKENK